jgi:hypothetical protein
MSYSMEYSATVEDLLRRFPGPVVLLRSRVKWGRVTLLGAGFAIIGAFMISDGNSAGYGVSAFFSAVALIGIVSPMPGSGSLRLTGEEFTITSLYRSGSIRWRDVDNFAVIRLRLVGFDFLDRSPSFGAAANRIISGRQGALPDNYRMNLHQLARLMTEWRRLALNQPFS